MRRLIPVLALFCATVAPSDAQSEEVDLELALMVDVSRSMSPAELEIQRRGYAEALRTPEVWQAILSGPLQTIALSYIEWSGGQEVVVDWRRIDSAQDLRAFADILTADFNEALRRTSISSALRYGARSITENAFDGLRRVIDISGDGPNNQGGLVTDARDEVLAQGIVINGLPLMTQEGLGSDFQLQSLDTYYRTCVIGGPFAFAIPVFDWVDFEEAVKRKLVLEIAGLEPDRAIQPAQSWAPSDCTVGEQMWEVLRQRWMMWDDI